MRKTLLGILSAGLLISTGLSTNNTGAIVDFKHIPKPSKKTPIAFLPKTATPPIIDGKLNDQCWENAVDLEMPRNTHTALKPREKSWFKMTYDQDNLYIYAKLEENYKDRLLGKPQTKRDIYGGDNIEIFIGSDRDSKKYYQFICNILHGSRYDGNSELGKSYNPDWEFKVDKDSQKGFINLEIKIPASAIERKAFLDGSSSKFNLCRTDYVSEPPFKFWPKDGRGVDYGEEISQWSLTGGTNHAVNLYGDIYLGNKKEYEKLVKPLEMDFILDRDIYDGQDTFAQVVVQPTNEGDKATLLMELYDDKKLVWSDKRLFGHSDLSFLLPVGKLKEAKYRLVLKLIGTNGQVTQKEKTFTKIIKPSEKNIARQGKIALNLAKREVAGDESWPIRTGVPFPKGSLWSKDHVRLLANGNEIPAQYDIRGRWSPNGSIRWLGLSFAAKANNGKYPKYELEFGKDIKRSTNYKTSVNVVETPKTISIDTGILKCQIDKTSYRGISKAWVDRNRDRTYSTDELAINASSEDAPYIIDNDDNVYLTSKSNSVNLVVEEKGPGQAVVRVEGWFENPKAGRMCKYITYYEFFAGLETVFVDHAVILTIDTKKQHLTDVGFSVAATGNHGFLGLDNKVYPINRSKRCFAVQERWNAGLINTGKVSRGKKIASWVDAGNKELGVTLYGQYITERFPKEFSIDNKKLTYHFWPKDLGNTFSEEEEIARNNVYKFFFAHEGPKLDFNIPDSYFKMLSSINKKEKFDYSYVKHGSKANAQGIAINEAFVLKFRTTPFDGKAADQYTELFREDPHAMPDLAWLTASNVFGPMIPADRKNYPELENFLDKSFLSKCWVAIKRNNEYGVWNFGDVHTYWYPHKDYAGIHRVWLSHHHGQTNIPWLLYAHFGDKKFLEWARINSHHTMNVNIIHYDDPKNPIPYHKAGNIYHVKGLVHWGGDAAAASHLAFVRYLQYKWCLTGSRRARDVSRLWVERVIADNFDGSAGRDSVTFVGEGLEFYKNSRDPRLLAQIKRKFKAISSMPILNQQHAFNWNRISFLDYHAMTGDQVLLKKLKNPELTSNDGFFMNPAYLYLLEGDKSYLDNARYFKDECIHLFEKVRGYYNNPGDKDYDGYATNFEGGGWIGFCGEIQSLFAVQKALKKAGMNINLKQDIPRKTAVMDGRYTRDYPYPHSWWTKQDGEQDINITCDCEDKTYTITVKDAAGKTIEGLPVKKGNVSVAVPATEKGLHQVQIAGKRKENIRDSRIVELKDKNAFIKLQKGKTYGIYKGTLLKILNKPDKDITIRVSGGDKHPSRLSLLDKDFQEISFADVWSRSKFHKSRDKILTIPAKTKGEYLHSSMEITLTPSETIKVKPVRKISDN